MSYCRPALLFLGTLLIQTNLLAQMPLKRWTKEISIYGGTTFGFPGAGSAVADCVIGGPCEHQVVLGRKTQPVIGGEIAVSVTKVLWLYGDYGYMFHDSNQATVSPGGFTDTNSATRHYWTATGGVELSFPTIHRIVPFLRVGAGYVRESYSSVTNPDFLGFYPPVVSDTRPIPSGTVGGGWRWYWNERQGLRFMVDGFFLGRSIQDAALPACGASCGIVDTIPYVTRRGGGRITIGYFRHFGR